MSRIYHDGNRRLQDEFDSRRIADRLEQVTLRAAFSDGDRAFIEGAMFFFLATADAEGRPDCSFKGGLPGFVRVTGPDELAFPDYDGNGMFKSLGNILVNPPVGLLFIEMGERPDRLRVQGEARVCRRRPADRELRRRAAAGAGDGAGDLPELPALHPARRGAVGLRAAAGRRAAGAGVEGVRGVPRRRAAAGPDAAGRARIDGPGL